LRLRDGYEFAGSQHVYLVQYSEVSYTLTSSHAREDKDGWLSSSFLPQAIAILPLEHLLTLAGGFQMLHAAFVVERMLDGLIKRHCNFHIAFFEGWSLIYLLVFIF